MILASMLVGCAPRYVTMKTGSLGFLSQQTRVNLAYRYDNMLVGAVPETAYVDKKVAEKNADSPGRGDMWKAAWLNDRTAKFEPYFVNCLNAQLKYRKKDLTFGYYPDVPYTMILHTTHLEPGFNYEIVSSPSVISADAIFIETKNQGNPVATMTINKVVGAGYYDVGSRLGNAYLNAGNALGKFIYRQFKALAK
jgi:hypothetical protein